MYCTELCCVATVISALRQVVKSPPPVSGSFTSLDVSALHFFSAYLAASPNSQLGDSWPGLKVHYLITFS